MTSIVCPHCGEGHDLAGIEPCFRRPDAFFEVPELQRSERISDSDEGCLIVSPNGRELRSFLRAILRVPIHGGNESICWGIWVELTGEEYFRLVNLDEDPRQTQAPPADCWLANEIATMPGTLGLKGRLSLTGPATRPQFRFTDGVDHLLAAEAQAGVSPERAMQWRLLAIHPEGTAE